MTQKKWIAAGSLALIALATAPVWAQSDNDSDDNAQGASQSSGQSTEMQPGTQDAQPMPSDTDSGPTTPQTPPPPPPPQDEQMGQGSQGSMQNGPAHRPGPPPPPPHHGGMMAKGMPLNHVCLNKTDAYSPGAVVKMNQKPYTCKTDPNDASGVLHWMPMPEDS